MTRSEERFWSEEASILWSVCGVPYGFRVCTLADDRFIVVTAHVYAVFTPKQLLRVAKPAPGVH